jgi:hypothetical protein
MARQKGCSREHPIPIDVMASPLGALAWAVCNCAVSVVAIKDVPDGQKQRLALVVSIEKFMIERAVLLFDEARALSRLRNPQRRRAVEEGLRSLIDEIREAGRSLAEEALAAASIPEGRPVTSDERSVASKPCSRLPLYHGTSTRRLKQILEEGCLRATDDPAYLGNVKLSLTTDRAVAEYFACAAALRDAGTGADEANGIVLELDGEGLIALLYEPVAENYDWDRAVECRNSIEP